MDPRRLPPLPVPAPLGTWIQGFAALATNTVLAGVGLSMFGFAVVLFSILLSMLGHWVDRAAIVVLVIVATWLFQIIAAVFEQDRWLMANLGAQVVDRGTHGSQHWVELLDGVRVTRVHGVQVWDPQATLTPSGFTVRVPNRRTPLRAVTRLASAAVATTVFLYAVDLLLAQLGESLFDAQLIALFVLPGLAVAAIRRGLREVRRRRIWTDTVRLEGSLLVTDVGRITLQPGFTVERFEDSAGNGLLVASGGETLRFRAAFCVLEWVEPRLQQARLAQGVASEVPLSLRSPRLTPEIG